MRIGLLIDTFSFGGAESMIFETARMLKESGHTPVLFHFGNKYVSDCATKLNIDHHIIPHHKLYKKAKLLPFFIVRTLYFFKRKQLDVLHSHLISPIFTFAIVSYLINLKHVGTLHDVYMVEETPKLIWFVKAASWLNTTLVAVSKPMREFYMKRGEMDSKVIQYIPNFTAKNNQRCNRAETRRQLNLLDSEIAIFSVGRLVKLKRFDILIDAMSKIQNNKVRTFIVGNGPEFDKLRVQIESLGLQKKVSLLGERDDIEILLSAGDIFTLTSETEGMSKSILEALAAGLPVVATNVGGNRDLIIHGDNGYLLETKCSSELAKRVDQISGDSSLRNLMGNLSIDIVEKYYSASIFLENHLELYKS